VILLTTLGDPRPDAERLAQQYIAAIAAPYAVGLHELTLSASIGVALYTGGPMSGSQLMTQADTAMYQAKRARLQICFFGDTNADMGVEFRDAADINR
jgi:GGDEF domain-containing protein